MSKLVIIEDYFNSSRSVEITEEKQTSTDHNNSIALQPIQSLSPLEIKCDQQTEESSAIEVLKKALPNCPPVAIFVGKFEQDKSEITTFKPWRRLFHLIFKNRETAEKAFEEIARRYRISTSNRIAHGSILNTIARDYCFDPEFKEEEDLEKEKNSGTIKYNDKVCVLRYWSSELEKIVNIKLLQKVPTYNRNFNPPANSSSYLSSQLGGN